MVQYWTYCDQTRLKLSFQSRHLVQIQPDHDPSRRTGSASFAGGKERAVDVAAVERADAIPPETPRESGHRFGGVCTVHPTVGTDPFVAGVCTNPVFQRSVEPNV